MKPYTWWFEVAEVVISHKSHTHWFKPGVAREAALAAVGKNTNDGVDVLERVLTAGMADRRYVQTDPFATKSVPAPVSDPNTECSQFPAVLTLAEFEDEPST